MCHGDCTATGQARCASQEPTQEDQEHPHRHEVPPERPSRATRAFRHAVSFCACVLWRAPVPLSRRSRRATLYAARVAPVVARVSDIKLRRAARGRSGTSARNWTRPSAAVNRPRRREGRRLECRFLHCWPGGWSAAMRHDALTSYVEAFSQTMDANPLLTPVALDVDRRHRRDRGSRRSRRPARHRREEAAVKPKRQ